MEFWPERGDAKFTIDTEDEEDLVKRIGIDSEAQSMGVPITKSYMLKRYGFPEPGPQDEIITPLQGVTGTTISSGVAQAPNFSNKEAEHNLKEVSQMMDALKLIATSISFR